nr:hypothetical protein [Vibrio furnissii]
MKAVCVKLVYAAFTP